MATKETNIVGLNITENTICAIQLSKMQDKYSLVNLATVSISPDIFREGDILNTTRLVEILDRLFHTTGLPRDNVVVGISENKVVMRLLKIPPMPKGEMKEVVKGEAEQYIVFSGQEVIVDSQPQEEVTEEGLKKVSILLAATSKIFIDRLLNCLEEANLSVNCLLINPLAKLSALNGELKKPSLDKSLAYLILGDYYTTIFIIKNRVLRFIRTIEFGFNALFPQDTEKLNNSQDQQFTYLEEWLSELETSLRFYQSQFPQESALEEIIISSDLPYFLQLKEALSFRLGLQVREVDVLADIDYKEEEFSSTFIKSLGPTFTQALGLAKHVTEEEDIKFFLNLLPQEKRKEWKIKRRFAYSLLPIPAVVLLFFLTGYIFQGKIKAEEQKFQDISKRVQDLANTTARMDSLKSEIDDLKLRIATLSQKGKEGYTLPYYQQDRYTLSALLWEIKRNIPKQVWLNKVNVQDNSLSIEGISLNHLSVAKFMHTLSRVKFIQGIGLEYSQHAQVNDKSVVKFKLIGMLKI